MQVGLAIILVGFGALALSGCEKKEEAARPQATETDAGPPGKAVDPALAQAVAAAASAGSKPGSPRGDGAGPPPNGIFEPGAADKEIAPGSLPRVTLGSDGSAPRLSLPAVPKLGSRLTGNIEIAVQADPRQGALPIDFALTLEALKPKATDTTAAASMLAKVNAAKLAISGAPAELGNAIAQLRGSRIEWQVVAGGGGTGFHLDTPKGSAADLRDYVRALSDTLALITLPVPDKPIGVGAYWMATTREGVMGLDLVTYRLVKVEKIENGAVTLNVTTKRYAASATFEIEGLQPDAPRSLLEFQSSSEGTLSIPKDGTLPTSGKITSTLMAALGTPQAKQRAMLEVQSRATLALKGG